VSEIRRAGTGRLCTEQPCGGHDNQTAIGASGAIRFWCRCWVRNSLTVQHHVSAACVRGRLAPPCSQPADITDAGAIPLWWSWVLVRGGAGERWQQQRRWTASPRPCPKPDAINSSGAIPALWCSSSSRARRLRVMKQQMHWADLRVTVCQNQTAIADAGAIPALTQLLGGRTRGRAAARVPN
jgi:hypothetical protein